MTGTVTPAPADLTDTPRGDAAAAEVVGEIYGDEVGQIYVKPAPPKLCAAIREDVWRKLCATHSLRNDVMLGAELGVSPTTVWRVRTRQSSPGIGFALQAMRIFGAHFEDLFEVLSERAEQSDQAADQAAA